MGKKLLEVGAGHGRYSTALAKEGYDVTAVELVERNLEILRRNAQGQGQLTAYQGDASNLDFLASNSFDAVLLFGPMYHLYTPQEQHKALDEAIRLAKPGRPGDGGVFVGVRHPIQQLFKWELPRRLGGKL